MSSKLSPRPRKHRQKDEVKQDIVAQVHKPLKHDVPSEESKSDEMSESNRTYNMEDKNNDKNSNYSQRTPSRDISIDGESTINTKIISLIETEMKRDINKHNHFSDSRPQSLSFYEDEKMPEELSGNLEMLSPEEKKHYRKRKEYTDLDLERNMYNSMQDIMICRDNDEILNSLKKSKSRKKKHNNTTDQEVGLGDSREMMIPKEKRKSKKKKREFSPMSTSSGKKKHRKRDEEFEPKTEITLALEELQDDVFENIPEDVAKLDKVRKSPKKSDKIYVQKKNKFEPTLRTELNPAKQFDEPKRPSSFLLPLNIAICYQEKWLPFTMLCHGFLGGIALAHYCYLSVTEEPSSKDFLETYAYYSDVYACLFSLLVVICLVSVFDRYDISHLSYYHLKDYIFGRKSSIVILIYLVCFVVHLIAIKTDDKISFILHNNSTIDEINHQEIYLWKHLSFWRAILASTAWLIIALAPVKDSFCLHLKEIERYFVVGN
ncbi:uncharacterized protein LOC108741081 [Agrilus planipennis]|uniref:Uncharacterized protein LOC108741081 n=1 Tax=Agrilus planipennis TaxID=224129 RepID=A0A1W4X554_AGRPL|nr:uncharacterized protein LOC108741081 [Agrilus planipennis]